MCVAKLTWTQEADTKDITVDIVDASIVKLALSYLYTGDYDDTGPAISKDFTDRGYACSMSDAEGSGDSTDGSHADALISGSDQNDGDRSGTIVALGPADIVQEVMLGDRGGLSEHGCLESASKLLGQNNHGFDQQTRDDSEAARNKARLEINTFVYILADYIQVPDLKALAVRKFAATLEGDCQDGLGDVCHLVYRSAPSTASDLRSCLIEWIASNGQKLIDDTKFIQIALTLPELLYDAFSCAIRQHLVTSDERDAAVSARLEAEDSATEANRRGQEDKQRLIARVNQARRCRHCSLENNVRFEREGSSLGRTEYSFRCTCRTRY